MPGWPCAARSSSPGRPPPTLRTTSWRARPIVRFARLPWPRQLPPAFIPTSALSGPETTIVGPAGYVVATRPCSANSSAHAASTAASTMGSASSGHPAMTAFTATFSTVAAPP